jgi:hypothetical protein
MKTPPTVIAILALLVCGTAALMFFLHRDTTVSPVACTLDAMQCPDGSYVGRSGPECTFAPCPQHTEEPSHDALIVITEPRVGAALTSPVHVSGKARGHWFFEGSAPVSITDWDGKIIGEGYVTAEGDWMTTDFVSFSGTITYTIDPQTPYDRGTMIFKKDNPSGLPEYDDARELPIIFSELSAPNTVPVLPPDDGGMVFCTMDAMLCPDGSSVGRVPPSCAFAPCPSTEVLEVQ